MTMTSLRDLLIEEVRDLYNAEKQLLIALPKMVAAASSTGLREAFQNHLLETQAHLLRLEEVFDNLGVTPGDKTCQAMQGLIAESRGVISADAEPAVHDAALIASAQRIEHYEIAVYGCARTFARLVGEFDVADMLQQTLDEEAATDQKLTVIAMSGINEIAAATV